MAELTDINPEEEHELVLESNDFHRPALKQIGNSIFNIKGYYSPKGNISIVPSMVQFPLAEIKDDLFQLFEKSEFLYRNNIVTGDILPMMKEKEAFVFLTESLCLSLDFSVLRRQGHMKCDVFIALPNQPALVLTLVDGDRESGVARTYNTHVATEVTKILRKFLDENINVIGGVLSLTDIKHPDNFREQVEKYTDIYSFFVTKRSLSMSRTKYEKVLTAFWAGVAETKSVIVGGKVDKDYLRFLTKEQCIVLVENINNREVTVTCQPGCGASTLMLEVARRLSNLENTLIVCRSEEEKDRLRLVYPNTMMASEIGHLDLKKVKCIIDETGTVEYAGSCRIWQFVQGANKLLLWLKKKENISEMKRKHAEQLLYMLTYGERQRRLKYLGTEVDILYLFDQIIQGYKTFHRLSGIVAAKTSMKGWFQKKEDQSSGNSDFRQETDEHVDHLMEVIQQKLQKQQHLFPVLGNLIREEKMVVYLLRAKTEYLEQATRARELHADYSSEYQEKISWISTGPNSGKEIGDDIFNFARKLNKPVETGPEEQERDTDGKPLSQAKTVNVKSKVSHRKVVDIQEEGEALSQAETEDVKSQVSHKKAVDISVEDEADITQLNVRLAETQKGIDQLEEQLASKDGRVEWEYNLECLSEEIDAMSIGDDVKEIIGGEVLPVPSCRTEKMKKCPDGEKTNVPLIPQLQHFQYGALTHRNILDILENVTREHQASLLHLQSLSSFLERAHGGPVHMIGEIDSPSCRPVSCPAMTLDTNRVNRKFHVSEDGLELENTKRRGQSQGDIGGFRNYEGTCSRLPIPLPPSPSTLTTPRYWETHTRVRVESVGLWLTLLEMGLWQEGEVDTYWLVSHQTRNSWAVSVEGCHTHRPGLCTRVYRGREQVGECCTNTMSLTPGTTAVLHYGVVLDVGRGRLAFLDLDRGIVLSSFNVQFTESLRPMFGVCTSPSCCTVTMRLVSGAEIAMTDTKKDLIWQALSTT